MAQQRGFKSTLLIVQESTFGTSPGNGTPVPIISHTLKSAANLIAPETITGRRDASAPLDGYKKVEGDVVIPLEVGNLAKWLTAAFGQASSPWKIQDAAGSFQLIDNLPDISKSVMYNGCKVQKLSFAIGGDGQLKLTAHVLAVKETVGNHIASPGSPAALEQLTHAGLTLSEGGSPCGVATQMTLDIEFGLDEFQYPIGGGAIASQILDGMVKVSGNLTCLLTDDTLWAKARAGTETSLAVAGVFGTKTLTIGLNEVRLDQPTKDLQGPKGRMIQFPYQAYFGDADPDESCVQISLVDSEA